MKRLLLLMMNLCLMAVASAQPAFTLEAVQDSIISQLTLFPQEKIHLHTDRYMYVPGEKIWFRVYVVDAFTHQSATSSQYAYVELINSSDSLMHRVMVNMDGEGLFHGNIFLSDFMPEGDYTLRAYTRYMENLGDDYFFTKPVRISNLKAVDTQAKKQPNEKSHEKSNEKKSNVTYEVSFFPEGGYLVEGVRCKTTFKALNKNGVPESITGEIVDETGSRITEVKTDIAGMGLFYFMPEAGKAYFLKCNNQDGQEKRFKLPEVQKSYSLAAAYRNKRHYIELTRTPGLPEMPLYLLAHSRGMVLYFEAWNYNYRSVVFVNDQLPSGIVQLVLFDGRMNPVSERLIFNKNDDQAQLDFSTDKSAYQKRENVLSKITITDTEGNLHGGHVSVAVTDDGDMGVDTNHTILSSLLLSSELRGTIESPAYYLQDNAHATYALDLLMLTHGWRRYEIAEVMKGHYVVPETRFEVAKEVSGSVRSLLLGRPVAKSEVLFFSNDGSFGEVETDSTGIFCFFIHFPDSVICFIQAKNQKGKSNVELMLNQEKFPLLKHVPTSPMTSGIDIYGRDSSAASGFKTKAAQRAQYDDDMRMIQLPEVVVSGKKIEKKDEARLNTWFNSGSDRTIHREDIEKRNPNKVSDMLFSVAGVYVNPDGTISIRGGGSPLILLDGMPMDSDFKVDDITIHDVESIDVFKGPSAAVFGMRGGNGAISITTRRGINDTSTRPSFNHISFMPTGYQSPVEFYSPKYDTPESRYISSPDFRTSLYWKPDLKVSDDGSASFEFYTSDFPTTYSVVIEGITNDGKIIRHVETIEVK